MKKNGKSTSISIPPLQLRKKEMILGSESQDILKNFMNLKQKYNIKENNHMRLIPKTNRDYSPSMYELSEFISEQINIKKKNRFVLPPLKSRNLQKSSYENKTNDGGREKQREIFNVIHNIKEKNEASFHKSKMYENILAEKKNVSSHDLLNLIMIKKGFMH